MEFPIALRVAFQRSSEAFNQIRTARYRSYSLIAKDENDARETSFSNLKIKTVPQRWTLLITKALSNIRFWYALLALLTASLIVEAVVRSKHGSRDHTSGRQDHFLKLLIPSSDPDSELCKTVLTAAVLGYPIPTIINYDVEYGGPGKQSERDFQRIKTIDEYLASHSTSRQEDIVVLLDTPWAWLQLRPEVLLGRYYRIVHEASGRLQEKVGENTMLRSGLSQSIVFAAKRSCNSTNHEAACLSVPQSPLSSIVGLDDLKHLSAAMVVGPVGKLRRLFKYVRSQAEKTMDDVDVQSLMEDAFRRQEYRREAIRLQTRSFLGKIGEWITTSASTTQTADPKGLDPKVSYEFGITLDYANELGFAVTEDGEDVEWAEFGALSPLPKDIRNSMAPFWTPSGEAMPTNRGWEDVKLLVDKATSSVPAIITLGWERGSSFQRQGWSNFWMSTHAPRLLEQNYQVPRLPVTSVVDPASNEERIFWDSEVRFDRQGMKTIRGPWGSWNDMCEREETYRAYGTS